MPESQFRKLLDVYLATVSSTNPDGPRLSFLETHLGGAATPAETIREDRVRALMKYFYTSLIGCAEEEIDEQMGPIDGTPKEPKHELRPDSAYYAYHLARRTAYEGFTDEQRKAVKGLVLRTAFNTMFNIAIRLEGMSEHEVEICLRPRNARDLEHNLHDRDIDGYGYWDEDLPASLTKYEY